MTITHNAPRSTLHALRKSLRRPLRIRAKQSLADADLVGDHQAERETDQSRRDSKIALKSQELAAAKNERNADRRRDKHHPGNRAEAEDQEIEYGPERSLNRRENE